ncbi:fumarylacetoacetate hydrolase family protein [Halorubrum sp. SY-15]|uniref:fumarylacetoacetate hydrolase family protein n=1 Tax=Halorubrum sp. SY-15 TaxID=3402277 RepID=UPI003EBBB26B
MRLARAQTSRGIVSGAYEDGVLETATDAYDVDGDLLAPVRPTTMYCVGRNYATTLEQMEYERPSEPDFFIKPSVSTHPPDTPIPYPSFTNELTYAGELAAVIGDRCADVAVDDVDEVLKGYTILNDLDALDQPGRTARKAFDGSGPLGPWIETDVDPTGIEMRTVINGEQRQHATTEQMLFSPREVVSFLSARFTLQPDDVIAFGSPANPGLIEPGDVIEISYDGVGTLRNTVEVS